ncbi:MAG: TolC family outer membrane protein [gamma proteobacterium symbiont of Bathyaustriella thionipta]|nr:TolC family outer membrane protein [gamma proteobacterium symbiont of Bathyaustriella thionipta]MCU7948544.1 TolC family outer membrane protein [gamma proteobacterium symbiont of Bathyaustriella thionipta]MCU7954497.1 TolC family outer membrane protein [gamma proteobacterium symbiont of Bathyaustriella thionipta]MCU7958178.1 TolC family outer membrane protein [gamma proteobacterium symbiont of Bathyaustriella thionipta]MCU7966511.1 TolC family outer membrane protein [gamma proteobacterium sy
MNSNNNHIKRKRLATLAQYLFLPTILSFAPVIKAENLLDIYSLAYQTDPVLKQAIMQRQSVGEGAVQAFSRFLPSISASENASGNNQDKPGGSNSDSSYNQHGYSLDLNLSVFDNRNYVNYEISNLEISKADALLNAAQQDLIIRSANAYFNTLSAADNVGFSKSERKAISRQLEQAKRRYEVGIIAITDVHEAQAGYDNANAQVISAENQLLIAKEALRELTNQYIDTISALAESIPLLPPTPEKITHWVDRALSGNYTLLAAKKDTFVQKENINLQRSEHYPTLGLTASYGYSKSNGPTSLRSTQHHDSSLGINLSIPIYEGNSVISKIRQAQYDFQKTQQAYDEIRNSTEKNTRSSYLNVLSEVS